MFGYRTAAPVPGAARKTFHPGLTRRIDPEYFGDIATDWPHLDVMRSDLGSVLGILSRSETLAVAM